MSSLKEALLAADGKVASVGEERRKLHCHELNGRFFCDAELLNPKTPEEAKFCLMDLWSSDSENSALFVRAFVAIGLGMLKGGAQ